ncbi:hypothetical protein PHMEG_00021948 [Phytophthora megakarya]|uniref:Bzip transcription factor n=1 Tax=Phytophthora megakarya TaxID=4795 RepID=A0A225VKM1_9STRA|nr:hypothetical protein PHMEG_00021948 [Phytophthora megakarya]
MYKHATSLYLSTNATALGVVVEYFRLFRFGVQEDVPTSEDMYGKEEAMVQRSFLNTAMAPNVTDGVVVGLLKLVDSWKFMSRCFHGIDIQPIRIVLGPGCVLNAAAKCSITITENTIRLAFPDLINDTAGRIIAEKLVDQEFTMYGTFEFKYDEQSGRITSIQSKFDMLTPVLRLLGCLKDVARVFENAVITPECRIRVTRREILLS